jgi:hypothetical protein
MPIEGASLGEIGQAFAEHLNELVNGTVTTSRIIPFMPDDDDLAYLSFRQGGGPETVSLNTNIGPLAFFLGQTCDAILVHGKHRLRTVKYRYHLRAPDQSEPIIRWEYVRERASTARPYCRHHIQGGFSLPFPDGSVSANMMHIPTGYVAVEDVIRFLIVELGVAPINPNWNERLEGSYYKFKTDFALDDPDL